MKQRAAYYKNGVFGKEGPYECFILFKIGFLRVIRAQTRWDNGAFYTWNTKVKLFWNVEELQ